MLLRILVFPLRILFTIFSSIYLLFHHIFCVWRSNYATFFEHFSEEMGKRNMGKIDVINLSFLIIWKAPHTPGILKWCKHEGSHKVKDPEEAQQSEEGNICMQWLDTTLRYYNVAKSRDKIATCGFNCQWSQKSYQRTWGGNEILCLKCPGLGWPKFTLRNILVLFFKTGSKQ